MTGRFLWSLMGTAVIASAMLAAPAVAQERRGRVLYVQPVSAVGGPPGPTPGVTGSRSINRPRT